MNNSITEQARLINLYKPSSLLEVGVEYSVKSLINVKDYKSVDINLDFKLDYCEDVRSIQLDRRFGCVLCCEVLEHIPFNEVEMALYNFAKLSDLVILSVPYSCTFMQLVTNYFKFTLSVPLFFKKFVPNGVHFWELGRKGYSKWDFEKKLLRHFDIVSSSNKFYPYHQFYVLKKKDVSLDFSNI